MLAAKPRPGRLVTDGSARHATCCIADRRQVVSVRSVQPEFVGRGSVAAGGRHVRHAIHRAVAGRAAGSDPLVKGVVGRFPAEATR